MRDKNMANILIFNVKKKVRNGTVRYHVRSRVYGYDFTRSFKEKGEAHRYYEDMISAKVAGVEFDRRTGRPVTSGADDTSFAKFASEFFNLKRQSLQGSSIESLQKALIPSVVFLLAKPLPKELLGYAADAVRNYILVPSLISTVGEIEEAREWIMKHSLCLSEINATVATMLLGHLNMKQDGKSQVTAKVFTRRRQAVSATLSHAVALDILKKNPIHSSLFTLPKSEARIDVEALPAIQEVRQLCDSLDNGTKTGKTAKVFASVLWLTGLRPGEALALRTRNFRKNRNGNYELALSENIVQVAKAFSNTGKSQATKQLKARAQRHVRRVPVPDELVEILTSYLANKEPDELLFPSHRHDGALSLSVFEDRWNKACNARWRLYDLRHLNASILIYSGLNIIEVAQRLGHSVQVCSSVYLHALESLNASPTTKLNEFLNQN